MIPNPVYFWREFEVPYGFLSQWFACPFTVDGTTYATTEMWMMVQKARIFGDSEAEQQMLATDDPETQRDLGRKVKGYDGKIWDQHKSRVVEDGNYHKFTKTRHDALMKVKLLATGDRELVEASPTDRIWGVGFAVDEAGQNRDKWGLNLLGKAIMMVRDRLREEDGTRKPA
ncbi:DUF1768-domain-containing protein [Myriangium duriaei CBS 260.36]|uniref:DUF1768-domain-containing protein n=1 Tax=Myriangium duriaei CBS 260.36 TaxID=1168546 RepID=A0A9P4MGK5_9PEZI|nr:DUF1768-domain-containing protein [Myriangium duriaei CBS 260.36]